MLPHLLRAQMRIGHVDLEGLVFLVSSIPLALTPSLSFLQDILFPERTVLMETSLLGLSVQVSQSHSNVCVCVSVFVLIFCREKLL